MIVGDEKTPKGRKPKLDHGMPAKCGALTSDPTNRSIRASFLFEIRVPLMRVRIKTASAFGVVVASFLLAGCTTWVKPGSGPAELDMATTHCDAVSYATLPTNRVTNTYYGASYSDRKKCEKNSINGCVKQNGKYVSVSTSTTDTNSTGRSAIFRDCMMQNGWRPE